MATTELRDLLDVPVIAAPMGGGPSTPRLVAAVAAAGGLGFVAGGYKTPETLALEIADVRSLTSAPFGVNVFVPGEPTADRTAVERYVTAIGGDPALATWDDDHWAAKLDVLAASTPAVVSFTFGCPPVDVVAALQAAGVLVMATVTSADEAAQAVAVRVDVLCAQGREAGAHRGSFRDQSPSPSPPRRLLDLLDDLRGIGLPVVAAGGIMDSADVHTVLNAEAVAAQCGTAFLRCEESGAHPLHKDALAHPRFTATTMTRAFSGRLARSLVNGFVRDHPTAPTAYPEINNATRPLRAAAAKAGDADRMSLWAGTGWRRAIDGPAGAIVERLSG